MAGVDNAEVVLTVGDVVVELRGVDEAVVLLVVVDRVEDVGELLVA